MFIALSNEIVMMDKVIFLIEKEKKQKLNQISQHWTLTTKTTTLFNNINTVDAWLNVIDEDDDGNDDNVKMLNNLWDEIE